jgi:hypothetical protein
LIYSFLYIRFNELITKHLLILDLFKNRKNIQTIITISGLNNSKIDDLKIENNQL